MTINIKNKIPTFINRQLFSEWMTIGAIHRRVFSLENYSLQHFVAKQAIINRPLKTHITTIKGRPATLYSVKEVLFRVIAAGIEIKIPGEIASETVNSSIVALEKQLAELEKRKRLLLDDIDSLTVDIGLKAFIKHNFGGIPFASIVDIAAAKTKMEPMSGVYFLFKDTEVVYVGQSVNVPSRLYSHLGSKDFDAYTVLGCPKGLLDTLEGLYIRLLEPPLNKNTLGRLVAPSLDMQAWEAVKTIAKDSPLYTVKNAA